MRKFAIAVLTAATLTISGLNPVSASAAAPKPGASCSTVGKTQTAAGKKFTCVKSGKKIVWNRGVTVAKPKPVAPTPVVTIPVITLDNLNKDWTLKVALSKVSSKLASLPESSFKPELIYSPNVLEAERNKELELLTPISRLFQEYFTPQKYQVIMFTNKDGSWADQALSTYGGSFPGKISDEIARVYSRPNAKCNFAFATKTASGAPIYYLCTDAEKSRDWPQFQTPPHEYFHLVQQKLVSADIPAWLHEGSAAFFGEAIGFANQSDPVASKRQQNINTSGEFDPDGVGLDSSRFTRWARSASAAEVSRVYKRLEVSNLNFGVGNKLNIYGVGSIATEVLVASFGVDGFMKIFTEVASGKSFENAFVTCFGITPDEFYVKLAPYINSQF